MCESSSNLWSIILIIDKYLNFVKHLLIQKVLLSRHRQISMMESVLETATNKQEKKLKGDKKENNNTIQVHK